MSTLKYMVFVSALLTVSGTNAAQTVNSTTELLKAIKSAAPGAVISLNSGLYKNVNIQKFHGSVTITSTSAAGLAVLGDLYLRYSSGITLRNLIFDTTYTPVGAWGPATTIPFQVADSKNIVLDHLLVRGSPVGTLATENSGIIIRESDHVTITNSEFTHVHDAITQSNDNYLTIKNNQCYNIRDDCIRGGGSNYVNIVYNHCWSNHPDGASDIDHPDCVQFWTSNTSAAAHDIYIGYNQYERGNGHATQGIFVKDETTRFPYRNLIIEGNVIKGAVGAGVSVDGALSAIVKNNYVCGFPDKLSAVVVRNTNGTVLDYNTSTYYAYENNKSLQEKSNKKIGNCPITGGVGQN